LQTCNSKQYLYKNSKHNSSSVQYLSVMPVRQLVGVPVRQLVGVPEHQWIEKMKNIAKRNIFGFVSYRSGLNILSV